MLKPSILALSVALLASPALAQVPQTSFGKPDLSGIWTNASLTPLARARGVEKLVVSEEEAQKIANSTAIAGIPADDPDFKNATYSDPNKGAPEKGGADFGLKGYDAFWVAPGTTLGKVKGEYRTSNIVEPRNGQLPFKDPAAVARKQQAGFIRYVTGNAPYEGPEEPALSERCLIGFGTTGGPGMLSVLYNNNYQFVLTEDHLMILVEMAHDARIVPIFDSPATAKANHKPDVIKPWLGDSVGWWEGDTLVVETINVRRQQAEQSPYPTSADAIVIERFTRTGENRLAYRAEITDPAIYTRPWTVTYAFRPTPRLWEFACHEGNYGLANILSGERKVERDRAAK
jgi:hypothetical protein